MNQHDQKVKLLEEKIAQQIELVAELICQGQPALAAMRVLDALTGELVALDSPRHMVCSALAPEGAPQRSFFDRRNASSGTSSDQAGAEVDPRHAAHAMRLGDQAEECRAQPI
ncbi:hypothetical protein I6F36_13910 [Bradyrhizobium sp. BRP19]|uniref:hypothetical protein n=1 Tax=Bradyrhizobium sp. BRP19 TaxID=2793823 RepID=UPI001CD1A2AB|nr:hypothetical protein [Bradyrhizobium sp. BRP19]MCA1547919.1 hypothetical protein [Bradyrhizobium sp. BRP19]